MMHGTTLVIIFFIISSISMSQSPEDLEKQYNFIYKSSNKGEMDLEICTKFQPCNAISNPFFYPFIVERICRCESKDCPDTFDIIRNNYTVFINNRQQLKFCQDQPLCGKDPSILKVSIKDNVPFYLNCIQPSTRYYWNWKQELDQTQNSQNQVEETNRKEVSHNTYRLEKRKRCNTSSCGYLREDLLYATYQFCNCKSGELCLPTFNAITLNVAMYKGLGYSSVCTKWN